MEVHVELQASDTEKAVRRGDAIVIVDVLRCSSTVVTALVNGASEIIPVRTVDEARLLKEDRPSYILAGERGGLKPEGFELGNSPREFVREKVYGKRIILTTTDGTKAFDIVKKANATALVGAFLNVEAVGERLCEAAQMHNDGLSLIACGKSGAFSFEDFICAGRILRMVPIRELSLSDTALSALTASKGADEEILELVRSSDHGKYLKNIGMKQDISFCLEMNRYKSVPVFEEGKITLS